MQATITVTAAMRARLNLTEDADSSVVNGIIRKVVCRALDIPDADDDAKYRREYAYLRGEQEQGTKLTKVQAARLQWLSVKLGLA